MRGFAATTVAALIAGSAVAQDMPFGEIEHRGWTAEQIRDAEPMELPTLDVELGAVESFEPLQRSSRKNFSMPGHDATAPIRPGEMQLFDAEDDQSSSRGGYRGLRPLRETFEPFDHGGVHAPFSSSRLIPTDARRFYPYRAAGRLFGSSPAGDFSCSAALISPRLLLTAGHCVHEGVGGVNGFYSNFVFVPAYHRGTATYKTWKGRYGWTTPSWGNGAVLGVSADFGILELQDKTIKGKRRRAGDVVGWFGTESFALLDNHTKKIGYPGEFDGGEVMHQVDSQTAGQASAQTSCDGTDMTQGSSGGPWIMNFGKHSSGQGDMQPNPNVIVGVTSFGPATPGNPEGYSCSSIPDDEFAALVQAACARKAGNC